MIPRHYLFSFLESIKRGDKTMSEKVLNNVRYILKHDTEENWKKASNFSPKNGEPIIYDIDSTHAKQRIKIGDGSTNVNNLPFIANDNLLESIKYVSESELSSEENLDASYQYCVTDLLSYDDLNSDLQAKIDKAASVDNKLDKVEETGVYPRLYDVQTDGTQSVISFTSDVEPYTIVQRNGSNGDVLVPIIPSSADAAASKQYVDGGFVGKLQSHEGEYKVYANKPDGDSFYTVSNGAVAGTLAERTANGDVKVPLIPTDNECAASKYYTDNTFVKSQSQYPWRPNYGVYTFALDGDTIKDALTAYANYPQSYALALYDPSAKLHSDPVSADDTDDTVANKGYVDGGFVKKVTPTENIDVAYVSYVSGGVRTDTYAQISRAAVPYAIVCYTADGDVRVPPNPVSDQGATSKSYVDAQISLVQDIANGANEDAANALTIAQEAKDLASSGTGRSGYGWQDGAGGPSGEPTDNRIYYLDRSTGEYYKWCDENCGLLQWVYKGSLKGPAGTAGAPGQNGAGWTLGSGSPSGEPSNNLLFYLDTSTGNYYHWEEDYNNCGLLAWVLKGNLKGPKGDKGATGASGDSGIGSSYDAPSIINISNRCYGGVGGVANAVYGEGAFYRYLKVNNAQVESGTDLVISAETSMFPANLSIDSYGESSTKMASIVYSSSSVSSGNPGYSINVDSEGKVLTITSEDGAAHEVNFVMQYV